MRLRVASFRKRRSGRRWDQAGFTLAEVLISLALIGIMIGGIITSYLAAAQRAEWASASAAAHRLAVMKMEQLKVAPWNELPIRENESVEPKWVEAWLDVPASILPEEEERRPRVYFTVDEDPEREDFVKLTVWCVWHLGTRSLETPNPRLVTNRARD
jgi:prepilin-type N-terminal cleavage/methylation domain-containing protein